MVYCLPPIIESRQSDEGGSDHGEDMGSNYDTPTSSESPYTSGLSPASTPLPLQATNELDLTGVIEFRMVPMECTAKPWFACLQIKCEDVPRLMREGFFWSAENILPEGGYMSSEIREDHIDLGCRHQRTWIIAKKPNNEAPQWSGTLEVASPLLETLVNFRIRDQSTKNVFWAYAWNRAGHMIYNYESDNHIHNYNCIYDDQPLKGWWPWPKESGIYTTFTVADLNRLLSNLPS
jgi:hypothetical protein